MNLNPVEDQPNADQKPRNAWQCFHQCMQDTTFCVLFTFLLSATVAFSAAWWVPPVPRVHDEFAYLMSADAFAHFQTSAPTHPHWQHFESFHIIHQPVYASKYPPGQSVTLAVGQWLGNPVIGACLATAFSLAAVMWMLIAWLPTKCNLFVSAMLATHPGIQLVWGQSFWGGAVAMAGGALLLGAFIRLDARFLIRLPIIAAIGISLLMISRPLEGLVLTAVVGFVLVTRLVSDNNWQFKGFLLRVILPGAMVGTASAAGFFAYNASITGHALTMPYELHEANYGWNPVFHWQQPAEKPPVYRHRVMERFFHQDVARTHRDYGTWVQFIRSKTEVILEHEYFFYGCSLVYGLFGIPLLMLKRRFQLALFILLPVLVAGMSTPWGNSHYLAPATSLILLIGFGGLIEIWAWSGKHPAVVKIASLVMLMHGFWMVADARTFRASQFGSWQAKRNSIQRQLEAAEEKDLIFVRYDDEIHNCHEEWVYNRFDIDRSNVVWAREISNEADVRLRQYFSDRKVWLVTPDAENVGPHPFPDSKP